MLGKLRLFPLQQKAIEDFCQGDLERHIDKKQNKEVENMGGDLLEAYKEWCRTETIAQNKQDVFADEAFIVEILPQLKVEERIYVAHLMKEKAISLMESAQFPQIASQQTNGEEEEEEGNL